MRKNINKIIAFAIGISVMSGSIIPAFADDSANTVSTTSSTTAENSKSNVLTLDAAINSAISISNTLALDELKIGYQDRSNDYTKDQNDFNNVSDDKKNYDDKSGDISSDKLKQQKDFDQDVLIHKVTSKYNDIVTSQMKIDESNKQLENKNILLNNAEIKSGLGMTISTDLESTRLDVLNLQNTIQSSQNALKDAEYSFKVLTGEDVTKYNLEKDIKFEPLKIDGSIDDYLDNVIDTYLKYSDQLVKLNKDYYDRDYEKDNNITIDDVNAAETTANTTTKPAVQVSFADLNDYLNYQKQLTSYNTARNAYTSALASRLAYLKTKLSNSTDETTLSENKKKFKDNLKTYYTNLLTSENNINYIKKNIELSNEKLSNVKLKYDLGVTTESDYNTQVLSSMDLDIQLRNEIINYNNLKEEIQKPWIAFSN